MKKGPRRFAPGAREVPPWGSERTGWSGSDQLPLQRARSSLSNALPLAVNEASGPTFLARRAQTIAGRLGASPAVQTFSAHFQAMPLAMGRGSSLAGAATSAR